MQSLKTTYNRLYTNGTIIDKEEYYPFGDSSLRTFTKKRYRCVGKEKDLESNDNHKYANLRLLLNGLTRQTHIKN